MSQSSAAALPVEAPFLDDARPLSEAADVALDSVRTGAPTDAQPGIQTGSAAALRRVASERLAAHRERRAAAQAALRAEVTAASEQRAADAERRAAESIAQRSGLQQHSSRVRQAVAARYERSVSYREFLAQEAAIALDKARAEAEVAARNAQAVAAVQTQLLAEIEHLENPEAGTNFRMAHSSQPHGDEWGTPPSQPLSPLHQTDRDAFTHAIADIAVAATSAFHLEADVRTHSGEASAHAPHPELTVRLYEDLRRPGDTAATPRRLVSESHVHRDIHHDAHHDADLDAEIAFRLAPEFEPHSAPVALSGNLIEFPRPLIAARKVRPRLAEGPLLAESPAAPQLRIFEVEPDQFLAAPTASALPETAIATWQTLTLEAAAEAALPSPRSDLQASPAAVAALAAPLSRRVMAAMVDGCLIAAGFLAALCTVALLAPGALERMAPAQLGAAAAALLGGLAMVFPALFFACGDATPGMRFTRLAFCGFDERKPSRRAVQRRILATLAAAVPLGLGILWAWMDDEHLGWHDRISRMALREY